MRFAANVRPRHPSDRGAAPFLDPKRPRNTFRLGFSSIPAEKFAPGIEMPAQILDRMA